MKKIILLIPVLCMGILSAVAQESINNYKYVVIPSKYEFLKNKDTYRLNTLTRVLFKKQGFGTYYPEEQLPDELFNDRCLALYVDVKKIKGGFRTTNLQIILKDCKGEEIVKTNVGKSSENIHEKRYRKALIRAFESIDRLNYSYQSNQELNDNSEKEEIEEQKQENVTFDNQQEGNLKNIEHIDEKTITEIVKAQKEVKKESNSIIREENSKDIVQEGLHQERYPSMSIAQSAIPIVYTAKKVENGFEIFSSVFDKYQFTMYSTIVNGVYIFQDDKISGTIIQRENGNWVIEYIKDGKYAIEKIKLIFQ